MKATATIDSDNWIQVTIEPETVAESVQMVQLAIARKSNEAIQFWLSKDSVKCSVTIVPKRDNSGAWLKPTEIPTP